ncbi:hypothetical protein [Chryseobacterium luteum]|uniref:Uncharacterized protein n=1 Tax=Chryseobacterium luteum TaxID=421531 RepID=A0A085ZXL4_9FLAO|nr:hypothetical protein [Chryseobacterium luteum]KFF09178.1 hypothetical protein IX38_01295 [Chryseobacterium luteum]
MVKRKRTKLILALIIVLIFYYFLSIIIFKGNFIVEHPYSFNSMGKSKKEGVFISNKLNIKIDGDSLKNIYHLNEKFYSCKLMYQKFYGFLISTDNEDEKYRRIIWEEPIEMSGNRNWIVTNDGEYKGEAFYTGNCDAKIGDTLILVVKNAKTDTKIGTIKIKIE